MGGPEYNIHHLRVLLQNRGQRLNDIFDAFVGGKQSKGQEHGLSFHPKLILIKAGVDEWHVGNAVGDDVDLVGADTVNLRQQMGSVLGHNHQPV